MDEEQQGKTHGADAAALGFYYQAFFALETLVAQSADNAAVAVERLDDVELSADGHTLLYQLKHSISATPPPITLKARALWRTVKVWADILPTLTLADTTLHLVAVGGIPMDSPLQALTNLDTDRTVLVEAMVEEAQRVVDARAEAKAKKTTPPYADRADGCETFLTLSETERLNLIRRALIQQNSPTIDEIEGRVSGHLKLLPVEQRPFVAKRLIEWWDRQIVYSLCGKRERSVTRGELQAQIMSIVGDLEESKLLPEFETASPPEDYQPDGMLARQIRLVEGKKSDLSKAIREEWKAREQRSRWLNANPAMAAMINDYDIVLQEHWSDHHTQMVEECAAVEDKKKCESGLKLLRWTHEQAPMVVRAIAEGWTAPYYVRGSYQVLAINLKVGWHPEFADLLIGDK
ncbi:hypothetical protein FRZ44_33020 [Hypericibacter terrae]|uniref:ABC-three component systems C-terminal domain-containing protein n=1 Tax=Hypericibacter terrae TaxID=2602015 RepID=A0A5J6MKH4_9PROT|nr:ABC-three component system protein [Hypericibacter terrae]QEX17998.1 hypothetical protein FRZ44_33020 [Hypericibacter terrae]